MDVSEIIASVKGALSTAWERSFFVVRTYWKTSLVLFLILAGALVWWGSTGFSIGLSRFFAAGGQQCTAGGGSCKASCGSGETSSGASDCDTGQVCCSAGQKTSPWSYCDAATKTCMKAPPLVHNLVSSDYNAPQCGTGACSPGQCRLWTGTDYDNWKPTDSPSGEPACEPLSEVSDATFPGYGTPYWLEGKALPPNATPGNFTNPTVKPAPINFPDCFFVQSYGGFPDGLFDHPITPAMATQKGLLKYFVVNNCPWEIHMVFLTGASRRADQTAGVIIPNPRECSLSDEEAAKLWTEDSTPGRDIPSCWNSATPHAESCGKFISLEFNLNAFTCGSVGIQLDWWHRIDAVNVDHHMSDSYWDKEGRGPVQTHRGYGMIGVFNWGKDCTGSPAERVPGASCGTVTGGGGGTVPAPAQLSVVCSDNANVLTWATPLPEGSDASAINKTTTPPGGTPSSIQIGIDLTKNPSSYTDTDVHPGYKYTYTFKNNVSVASNPVYCPPQTGSPGPTTTATASSGPAPVCGPNDLPDGDLDGDGIPNNVECPGYVCGSDLSLCPDYDHDGVPDILDTDSDNDGVPDATDCNRLGANTPGLGTCTAGASSSGQPVATVSTGPGDVTVLALIISSLVALLYASYTHSPLGRKREVEEISRDQGPMDFRS